VLAAGALVMAGVEAGIFTAIAEVAPVIPVFLMETATTIGAYFTSLSANFAH